MYDVQSFLKLVLGLDDPWFVKTTSLDQENWRLDIYIDFAKGSRFACPECGAAACPVHDTVEREWRHLNLFQYEAWIHARVPRCKCPEHGVRMVEVPWARPGSGFTLLFEGLVMFFAGMMPVAEVAETLGEHDTRIWRIVHDHVDKAVESQDLSDVTRVGVDETARRKGHRYITAFVDLDERGAVFVTGGKGKETVADFAKFLCSHGGETEQVTDFSSDLSPAFISGIGESFPEARITFDRFHIMKLMNNAVDEVRRSEQKERAELLVKTRSLWLYNPSSLTKEQQEQIERLADPKNNLKTARAWRIKLALQDIFRENAPWSSRLLMKWYKWAVRSRLEPVVNFARTVKKHWDGIVNYFKSGVSNGILEGLNSLFKAAAAKARGYRTVRNAITAYYLVAGRIKLEFTNPFPATHSK